jgi:hypothetical protein
MKTKTNYWLQLASFKPNNFSFKVVLLPLLLFFTTLVSYAQVTVTGALVGNGTYATQGAAFTAINGGSTAGRGTQITGLTGIVDSSGINLPSGFKLITLTQAI